MNIWRRLRARFGAVFQKGKLDAEMEQEMRAHLELRAQSYIDAGMSPGEARLAALRQFGGKESIKEKCRDLRGVGWIETFTQDIRFGARQLRKNPGFTAVAVLTLALGIGANMVIFTLINGLLFKPVMAKSPEKLASLYQYDRLPNGDFHWQWFSYPDFAELRANNEVFDELAAVDEGTVGRQDGDLTLVTPVRYVSANYMTVFGVAPIIGRTMTPAEEASGIPVAVLAYGFWQRLGGDPGILGRTLKLTRGDVTVIGVMPKGFTGDKLVAPAMFLPVGVRDDFQNNSDRAAGSGLNDRGNRWLSVVGRLKQGPGATPSALAVLSARFPQPDGTVPLPRNLVCEPLDRFDYHPTRSEAGRQAAPAAALAIGLSVLVLLVACLNLANMMLARGAARRKEIAVRLALGAGRRRVLRQLFTEGVILAAIGGGASLLLSASAIQLFMRLMLGEISQAILPFNQPWDWRLLGALTAISGLAAVFFALGPALKLSRLDCNGDLKRHGTDEPGKPGGRSGRNLLAVAQLALSMALLVAAGLFTRSAANVFRATPGFDFGDNFYLQIDSRLAGTPDARVRQLARSATERLAALPGVESVSPAMWVPFGNQREGRSVWAGATPPTQDDRRVDTTYNMVGAGYFHTLGIPLLRGREFTRQEAETTNGPPAAIINQKLATELWPGGDAVGRLLQINVGPPPNRVATVVGVVADVGWSIFDRERPAEIYEPLGQRFPSNWRLHIRLAPGAGASAVKLACREELRRLDPRIPLVSIEGLSAMHQRSMPSVLTRTGGMLFGAFGAVAMLLSFLGIYGLKAYQVARRTQELGIRIALGAGARDVTGMILRESTVLALSGLGLGFLLSLAVGRLASQFLYQVSAFDPLIFSVMPLCLLGVVLFACWIPARRAAKVDPMVALRCE